MSSNKLAAMAAASATGRARRRGYDEMDEMYDDYGRQKEAGKLARHHQWAGKGMQIGGQIGGPAGAGWGALAGGVLGTISELGARDKYKQKHKGRKAGKWYSWDRIKQRGDDFKDTHWRTPKEREWGDMAAGFAGLGGALAKNKVNKYAKGNEKGLGSRMTPAEQDRYYSQGGASGQGSQVFHSNQAGGGAAPQSTPDFSGAFSGLGSDPSTGEDPLLAAAYRAQLTSRYDDPEQRPVSPELAQLVTQLEQNQEGTAEEIAAGGTQKPDFMSDEEWANFLAAQPQAYNFGNSEGRGRG